MVLVCLILTAIALIIIVLVVVLYKAQRGRENILLWVFELTLVHVSAKKTHEKHAEENEYIR